jgi:predicted secreted protein
MGRAPSFAWLTVALALASAACASSGDGKKSRGDDDDASDGGGGTGAGGGQGGQGGEEAPPTTHFAPDPANFAVPSLNDSYGFATIASSTWATMDIDGDGNVDLIHTADPSTGYVWGGDANASWRVYLGDGSAFAPNPITWKVPTLGDSYGFYSVAYSTWATIDLDHDGHLDLVHTADPLTGYVWGGDANASWRVYLGGESGFATSATTWAVPPAGDSYGFYGLAGSTWATLDLNGDGRLDLVQTADPLTGYPFGGDANASWKVYRGGATGFATSVTSWKVPTLGDGYGFYNVASSSWATLDLDGDAQPDLVHTADPSSGYVWGGDANASWHVYRAEESGFAATFTSWKVPTLGDGAGFYAVASSSWATLDLDGDGLADLVHTYDPSTGMVWGGDDSASWRRYPGSATGFAPMSTDWSVPTLGDGYGFYSIGSSTWATLDMDGDRRVDLVHSSDPTTGTVWGGDASATWHVFHGTP